VVDPNADKPSSETWFAPVDSGKGSPFGYLRLEPDQSKTDGSDWRVAEKTVRELASAIAGILGELLETQHGLWEREAELAAGVPLAPHVEEEQHLAARLAAVLKGGAEAVGCHAAALYMLDEATTSLKLRSSWGLPRDRLIEPARPLRGSLADLEALLGHAVVLEDAAMLEQWNAPENFPSAVCVPLSTSTTILGTLWMFSNESRDFTDRQTNIIEVVAGRLASDLDREVLIREGIDAAQLNRQLAVAERMQRSQLPTIAPLLDGWDVAGWTAQVHPVGGDFFDWFGLPDGLVAVAVGDAMHQGIAAAMSASAVKAALRAHGQYLRETDELLRQLNLTLWAGSAGDQFASLFYGLVETATGVVRYATAGQPAVVRVAPGGWESLSHVASALGEGPESCYSQKACHLEPGEALVVFTDGFRDATDSQGKALGETGLAEPLAARLDLSAKELVAIAKDRLQAHAQSPDRDDRTVLVVKRRAP
jgi:serine phosphatase RsbU (regulator of sigma subunit)